MSASPSDPLKSGQGLCCLSQAGSMVTLGGPRGLLARAAGVGGREEVSLHGVPGGH